MARTLTGPATTSKNAATSSPRMVIKVEWPAPVGDKYYSEQALSTPIVAQGRIVRTGALDALMRADDAQAVNVISDFFFELEDTDGVIRGYIEQVQTERTPVYVYQHFIGNAEGDLVLLMKGMLNTPVQRSPVTAAMRFDVTDIVSFFDEDMGLLADLETFPAMDTIEEGRMLPIVYGYNKKVRGVNVGRGDYTEVTFDFGSDDMSFTVVDGKQMPQGVPLVLRVGQEEMVGSFSDNVFNITERARILYAGWTTQYTGTLRQFRDMNIPASIDNFYKGYLVEVIIPEAPGAGTFFARIAATESEYGVVKLAEDLRRWDGVVEEFFISPLQKGTVFSIRTPRLEHRAGELCEVVVEEIVFIVNDAPSNGICDVWMPGQISTAANFGDRIIEETKDTLIYVPRTDYRVNLDDPLYLDEVGHNVTTVTFNLPLSVLVPDYSEHAILVDIRGTDRGPGMIEDADDIIQDLFLFFTSSIIAADIDNTSFNAAGTQIEHLDMSIVLTEPRRALATAADIAFQARCVLLWEGGKAFLRYLENSPAASSVVTVGTDEVVLMSPELYHSDYDALVTEVIAHYVEEGNRKAVFQRDDDAFATFGRRVREIDLWAYDAAGYAQEIAKFWVTRWSKTYERIRLTTFLETLELERHDTVTLAVGSDLVHAGQQAIVERVTHTPGNPLVNLMDQITLDLMLPRGPGCDSVTCEVCETSCETGTENCVTESCGFACETTCQPFGCDNVTEASESGGGGICLDQAMVWCLSTTQSDTTTEPPSDECFSCMTNDESGTCKYDWTESSCLLCDTGAETVGKCYPWSETVSGDTDDINCQTSGTQTEDAGCPGCENNQTSPNRVVGPDDLLLNCGERKPTLVTDDVSFGDLQDIWQIVSNKLQNKLDVTPFPTLAYDANNLLGVKLKAVGGLDVDALGIFVDWSKWPGDSGDFIFSDPDWTIDWSNIPTGDGLLFSGGNLHVVWTDLPVSGDLTTAGGTLAHVFDAFQPFSGGTGLRLIIGEGLKFTGSGPATLEVLIETSGGLGVNLSDEIFVVPADIDFSTADLTSLLSDDDPENVDGLAADPGAGTLASRWNHHHFLTAGDGLVWNTGELDAKPERASQSGQPTPASGYATMWHDTDDGKIYLVYNDPTVGVKQVELL